MNECHGGILISFCCFLHLLWQDIYDKGTLAEFKNEILTLSKIEHLNLVRFHGFVDHGDERIILVEYVANGTLREHLDGKCKLVLSLKGQFQIELDASMHR